MKLYSLEDIFHDLDSKRSTFVIEYCKDHKDRRAAMVAGFHPDEGLKLLEDERIKAHISKIQQRKLDFKNIDADNIVAEAWDNHYLARQQGNISASNTALTLIAKTRQVDAFASEKIDITTDSDLTAQLLRARERRARELKGDDDLDPVSF